MLPAIPMVAKHIKEPKYQARLHLSTPEMATDGDQGFWWIGYAENENGDGFSFLYDKDKHYVSYVHSNCPEPPQSHHFKYWQKLHV